MDNSNEKKVDAQNENASEKELETALDGEIDEDDDFEGENDITDIVPDMGDLSEDADDNYVGDIHQPVELLSRRSLRKAREIDLKKIVKSKAFKIALAVFSVLLAAAMVTYAICIATLPTDVILRNVYVEELDVSGLNYTTALESIKKTYLLENQQITLSCNGESYSINGLEVDLTASPEQTAKKAFEYGKSGNKLADGFKAFTLLFRKHTIVPPASFDEEKMREKVNEFGILVLGERRNHYVEIADGKSIVWPGSTGYDGNADTALSEITEAIKNGLYANISLSLSSAAPDELTIGDFDGAVYADPVDAHFELENGEVKVVDETNGRYINKEEAAVLLENVREGGEPVEIPFEYSYPNVKAADIKDKLFANSMASYSTSYGSSTANRASNVALAASKINGKILMPGDVFSFNDTVGRRSVANGFKTATEYVDGKSVEGIGGGTCQVSSTLYNAVLYADLEIVTRTNHMFTVSYVPNGQDATVADSGPDFKFKNNTAYPIKISASAGGGTITVAIIGTNWEPNHEVKISNSTSYSAKGDTFVKSTRTVYANGSVIKSEALPSSTYKQHVKETSSSAADSTNTQSQSVSAPVSQPEPAAPSSDSDASENTDSSSDSDADTSQSSDTADDGGAEE